MGGLTRIGKTQDKFDESIKISQASFPAPFRSGLEFSAPARGTWNIVHTGMLIPESHQIFVCAQGCLRGVVLTAAELGMSHRFSTVCLDENNVISGGNEELIIDGVTDIINKLPKMPRAVLVYTSCIHHFIGCDLSVCYNELRRRFPDIRFADCYMNPIMRKSGLTPDARMRQRLYSILDITELSQTTVSIVGNDLPIDPDSELLKILDNSGFKSLEVSKCSTFDEYLEHSKASWCITTFPAAIPAGKELQKKHKQIHIHLPFSFDIDEIERNYRKLCETLGINYPDFSAKIVAIEKALCNLKHTIGTTPIAIDYTAFTRPLSLAKLLLDNGLNVKKIYLDSFSAEEENDYNYLKEKYPELLISPTINSSMRLNHAPSLEKVLAIGQKAAYFEGTEYLVNIIENGGYYGFEAILKLCNDIIEAYSLPKDTKNLIQIKGMGCCCCG